MTTLLKPFADDLTPVDSAPAGTTVVAVGLKNTITGDTLVAHKGPLHSMVLPGIPLPEPVFALALEPEESAQQQDLEDALAILTRDDPSLRVHVDEVGIPRPTSLQRRGD